MELRRRRCSSLQNILISSEDNEANEGEILRQTFIYDLQQGKNKHSWKRSMSDDNILMRSYQSYHRSFLDVQTMCSERSVTVERSDTLATLKSPLCSPETDIYAAPFNSPSTIAGHDASPTLSASVWDAETSSVEDARSPSILVEEVEEESGVERSRAGSYEAHSPRSSLSSVSTVITDYFKRRHAVVHIDDEKNELSHLSARLSHRTYDRGMFHRGSRYSHTSDRSSISTSTGTDANSVSAADSKGKIRLYKTNSYENSMNRLSSFSNEKEFLNSVTYASDCLSPDRAEFINRRPSDQRNEAFPSLRRDSSRTDARRTSSFGWQQRQTSTRFDSVFSIASQNSRKFAGRQTSTFANSASDVTVDIESESDSVSINERPRSLTSTASSTRSATASLLTSRSLDRRLSLPTSKELTLRYWYRSLIFLETLEDDVVEAELTRQRRLSIPANFWSTLIHALPSEGTEVNISAKHSYPDIGEVSDPARRLTPGELLFQRATFFGTIIAINLVCLMGSLFSNSHQWVLALITFVKCKDVLSAVLSPLCFYAAPIMRWVWPPRPVETQWILTLIPAYSESEEQIVKTIFSLRDNQVEPHKQVMCVMLDGKPRDIKGKFTRHICSFSRPYVTFKWKKNVFKIDVGFIEDVPVIVFDKEKNAGKKDSLIVCHDLFNYPRDNIHQWTKLLRDEIWEYIMPVLVPDGPEGPFTRFDMVFCTDADSIIHNGAVASLANALARDKKAIAACGLVLVELEPGLEWSIWNLYQQFQYCFGQFVRRRAEATWGKVTCLPGCITMIAVRPECAGAIRKYAEPVVGIPVIHHQVQYLGTDRRLTYSLLSQSKGLHTLFVPEAVSETVAPQSLTHYLSQRRRWGSNAYFNNWFYCMGENMTLITRVAAFIEVVRLSLVYYRASNTIMFIKNMIVASTNGSFDVMAILPVLIVSQATTISFMLVMLQQPALRPRAHKLLLGFTINKFISPFMSMAVFTKVAKNVGSQGISYNIISRLHLP